jgi:hypothetical protein
MFTGRKKYTRNKKGVAKNILPFLLLFAGYPDIKLIKWNIK